MVTPSQVAPQGHQASNPVTNPGPSSGDNASNWDSDIDDDNEREDDHKPLISPSTDIKESGFGDFEDVLEEGFDFDGVFAFSHRYEFGDAPNPYLRIEGLGTLGLPLSAREARALTSVSSPICEPKSDATAGIWEIPAEKISFRNPRWASWIDTIAGVAASRALTAYSVKPDFTLKKLVIHGQSSSTTRQKESIGDEDTTPKIGDFIVILPSAFDGGMLELRHASQTKSLNLAHQSELMTSVVAAYSGVEHTLASVTSGYRLSLVYEIIQPITATGSIRPALPEMQGATQKIRNILLSWKQDVAGEAPEFLACLLQHRYTQSPNFHAESLTGADLLLLSHLRPLAHELKFALHLAHFTVTVTTTVEASGYGGCGYGGYGRYGRYGYGRCGYDDSDEEVDDDEFEDDEGSTEQELNVTRVVKLSGMPVGVNLDLETDDLINGSVTDDDPDSNILERDEPTTGTRTKIYKRTALLIWPKNGNIADTVMVGDVYDYACNALRNSLTPTPTPKESKLMDNLLECCRLRPQEAKVKQAVQVIRESADRWNDAQLLLRMVAVCGVDKNIDLMGVEGFVSAYQAFGWSTLKDFCNKALKNDPSNAQRRALVGRLTQMGLEEKDAEVSEWCKAQEDNLLTSLGQMDASHIPWLMDIAKTRGGQFFQTTILPQLKAQKLGRAFWISFIRELQQTLTGMSSSDSDTLRQLVIQGVAETVQQLPAFPIKNGGSTYNYTTRRVEPRKEKNSVAILQVIQLTLDTQTADLCASIFAKMRDAARSGAFLKEYPPWLYYAELSPAVAQAVQSASISAATQETDFRRFFVDVVNSMLSAARKTSDGKVITPCSLTDQHKSIIVAAARKAGGITVLRGSLGVDVLKGHDSTTLQGLTRLVAKEFPRSQLSSPTDVQAYNDLVISLVHAAIDTFDMTSLKTAQYSYNRYLGPGSNPSDQMIRLVQFCFEVGAKGQCDRLLLRFVAPPTGSNIAQHVSTILTPFLPVLGKYLVTQRLDFQIEPFKKFCAAVIRAFADKVMEQKPSEVVPVAQLQSIGCGCMDCQQLKAFFLKETQTISFSRKQNVRTHLEQQLGRTRAWGVKWETLRYGSPHTLQVTKPASMTALGLWVQNSEKGKTLLSGLGDFSKQVAILGGDYTWVHARIHGSAGNPPPMPLGNANQGGVKRPAPPVAPEAAPLKKVKTS